MDATAVIGAGRIGRQIALALALGGVPVLRQLEAGREAAA